MIWIISGPNDFARQQKLKELVADFLTQHDEIGLEYIDGETVGLDRLGEALTSLPFLADKKLVVLKNLAANKVAADKVEELLQQVPETTDVVVIEPKVDKRSSYYKQLKKHHNFIECNNLDAATLATWVVAAVKDRGGSISPSDARLLVSRIGESQQTLSSEIDKLLLYDQAITKGSIEALTDLTPQSTVFELLGAAFEGRIEAAIGLYDEQRSLRVEPQAILGLIAWQLHLLSLIKTAKGRSSTEIARAGGVSPYAVGRSMTIASNISAADLKQLVHETLVLDSRLKSENIDVDGAMKNLLLQISQLRQAY